MSHGEEEAKPKAVVQAPGPAAPMLVTTEPGGYRTRRISCLAPRFVLELMCKLIAAGSVHCSQKVLTSADIQIAVLPGGARKLILLPLELGGQPL